MSNNITFNFYNHETIKSLFKTYIPALLFSNQIRNHQLIKFENNLEDSNGMPLSGLKQSSPRFVNNLYFATTSQWKRRILVK